MNNYSRFKNLKKVVKPAIINNREERRRDDRGE